MAILFAIETSLIRGFRFLLLKPYLVLGSWFLGFWLLTVNLATEFTILCGLRTNKH